ncbi:MAG: 3-oxoacyl-ACP synthase III [Puniceicoccaceae bacterium]
MRFQHTFIEHLTTELPEEVWTSEYLEARLEPAYRRAGLQAGRIELMTGIRERRMWPRGTFPSEASARAAGKLIEKGVNDLGAIDVLMHCGVSRDRLEPATAAKVHQLLGLRGHCQIFDLSNACLGFLNGLLVAASMVEGGLVKSVLVAAGENGRPLVEGTIKTLNERPDLTRKSIKPWFANLTIGSGAVAGLVVREDVVQSSGALRLRGGFGETDTSFAELCQGDASGAGLEMATDSEELLAAGMKVAKGAWGRFCEGLGVGAKTFNRFVTHQVGRAHQRELFKQLSLDEGLDYPTYPVLGNIGSVSCPGSLALGLESGEIRSGERVALLGIGSGLSSLMLDIEVC